MKALKFEVGKDFDVITVSFDPKDTPADATEKSGQFAHSTAIMLVTPQGKLAQYYYGVEFHPSDLRLGLIQASQNKIGTIADKVLLYCYHYDPQAGKYSAVIGHIIQLAGGVTILSIGSMLLLLFRRGSDSDHRGQGESQAYVR